jgi:hypothetical protein
LTIDAKPFTFEISLSVLNHLGRNLYRSFATVLGEAISNSWDADADNVWVYTDEKNNSLIIKDDGVGMNRDDFQNKFLKIGYSKRNTGKTCSPGRRPFIGRKGIGKLALLSCAEQVSVISKRKDEEAYVGGVIDNAGLDAAIREDKAPQEYCLEKPDTDVFKKYTVNHDRGTLIAFTKLKEGARIDVAHIRSIMALHLRFSIVDRAFKMFVDGKQITLDDLSELIDHTEFLWIINDLKDPYVTSKLKYDETNRSRNANLLDKPHHIKMNGEIRGFIASVRKAAQLKLMGGDEQIGVDLFVNGRVRECDLLRHIPTGRVPEDYLYGQIHFDSLNDDVDRFATNREGVIADDAKFKALLEDLKKVVLSVIYEWDVLRGKHHEEGDSENERIPKKKRKAVELFDLVSAGYMPPYNPKQPQIRDKVGRWVTALSEDAAYNVPSYVECFVSENLLRKHIEEKRIQSDVKANDEIRHWMDKEDQNLRVANISIPIRRRVYLSTSYLSMDFLARLVDKAKDRIKDPGLSRDAEQYKPIRDALMHTSFLTDQAKAKLTTVAVNIQARVRALLAKG